MNNHPLHFDAVYAAKSELYAESEVLASASRSRDRRRAS
jgi:hypothetical protein